MPSLRPRPTPEDGPCSPSVTRRRHPQGSLRYPSRGWPESLTESAYPPRGAQGRRLAPLGALAAGTLAVGIALLQSGPALAAAAPAPAPVRSVSTSTQAAASASTQAAASSAQTAAAAAGAALVAQHSRDTSPYYVPPADRGALTQIGDLLHRHRTDDAARIAAMVTTPQAVWFTDGTPAQIRDKVRRTVREAAERKKVPVLVAYNLPFRDCAQYSTGGATDTAAYLAWIKGFAAGIGKQRAVVILEPDGLGIIPFYQPLYGSMDWCQPRDTAGQPQPGATPADRFAALNGAVDALSALPGVDVYLDGTNSAWLGPGEITDRLIKAGVQRADGFFLNVSNYRTTEESNHYGGWVSACLTTVKAGAPWAVGHPEYCPGQYSGSSVDYSPAHVAEVDAQYVGMLAGAAPTTRYLVDTSRSGKGPNDMSAYAGTPYNQPAAVIAALRAANWCNPPGAGAGLRPTSRTGVPLAAAYLWVKTPGQSDGSCDSAGGARAWDYTAYNPWGIKDPVAQSHFDPLWGLVDPAAGAWFPQQALELARLAQPPLPTRR